MCWSAVKHTQGHMGSRQVRSASSQADLRTQVGCKQPRGQALSKGHQAVLCPGRKLLCRVGSSFSYSTLVLVSCGR